MTNETQVEVTQADRLLLAKLAKTRTSEERQWLVARHRIQAEKRNNALAEDIEVLRKLATDARDAEAGCNRIVELLKPEWERFEKRDGSHNTYASRVYADHVSSARTNKRDADALERIIAALEEDK